ncbi:copper-translocating P-type ATPase [Periweissella cryptocerci]|uniref:P-type Cu(+) transporter n=2 Tax=Periweissella cryptocerci TaxID=2506420 RepID=A0A4P6YX76_9LACO|nr:copper-translocating P-type ATPase [Periweissella cryptocerci]
MADMGGMNHEHMNMGDMDMAGMDMDHDMMNHGGHMMHMGNMKRKLIVSVILTIPLLLLSPMMGLNMPFTLHDIPAQQWIVLALGSVIFFYGGTPFFSGAKGELQARKPAMMMLITLGITVAYCYSVYATVMNAMAPHAMVMDFFWELATLVDIMLLGHLVEMNAVTRAGSAVSSLAQLIPKQAHMVHSDGSTMDMPVSQLHVGDHVLVKATESIPADGLVVSGQTTVDEAMLTGEATQVIKQTKNTVLGGSINGSGVIEVEITSIGTDSFIARVQKLVETAQSHQSKSETLANKVAGWLFYAATGIGIAAMLVWTLVNGFAYALPIAVTVFIIACPHALGLAVPLVTARFTAIAAQNGLLIQNREPLEQIDDIKYALMDKTGTLTEGNFKVRSVKSVTTEYSDADILAIMATLESGSTHPLAQGILNAAKAQHVALMASSELENIPGTGITGVLNNDRFAIVAVDYLTSHKIAYDQNYFNKLAAAGNSVSYLVTMDKVVGIVAQGDEIKATAVKFIRDLQAQNITPVMLTGDNEQTAKRVADVLGITEVQAHLKPADKAELVKEYQQKGHVMMIGDGVNDSPALAQADLGIAIGSGTDVAIDAADVVLIKSDPADVTSLIKLAKATNRKMKQNLWWGAGYNVIAIPLAAGILIPLGFRLDPMVGAILMSLSTVIVAINAMRLKL